MISLLTDIIYFVQVIPDVGLCIAFYDFLEVGDPFVYPGEGASHQQVRFRVVVFRPFVEEILTGKVINCTADGIKGRMLRFPDSSSLIFNCCT